MNMDAKNFTLRMPLDLYQRVAHRKKKSVSEFVIDAVREKLDREREEEVRIGFESLAQDYDQPEYDLWAGAQKRAMKHADD
jgi:hypothetical protein